MPRTSASRRTQFSSCDACHRSRVACDASKMGHQPGQARSVGSCSRCLSRNRMCTFKWIKKQLPQSRKESVSGPVSTAIQYSDPYESTAGNIAGNTSANHAEMANEGHSISARARLFDVFASGSHPNLTAPNTSVDDLDILLDQWSGNIFHHVFGTLFGHLVGRNGCPLVHHPSSDLCFTPIKLFSELDKYMDKQSLCCRDAALTTREQRNHEIDQSLQRAIQSFTARWLPLVMQKVLNISFLYEETVRNRWRASRRDMLKVINRPSYRSVLTLYLFGQTPVPPGISDEEETDGISSMVSSQTALLQLQQLRGRNLSGSRVPSSTAGAHYDNNYNFTQTFLDFETRVYWAAVVWDTSNALTLNFRSSLTSGLKGACLEPVWRLVRAFLVGAFHTKSEDWRTNGLEMSDHTASEIISAAAICTTYTWRAIASVKEALREGVEENDLLFSWDALLDAFDIFKTTVQPLLALCERHLHFLGQVERLSWYQVVLHYHLGILTLINALEDARRSDLLSQTTKKIIEAEQEAFNVLKFGLESKYTIRGPPGPAERPVTLTFIAIDPNPQYVIALVQLMDKCFHRKYERGDITEEVHSHLSLTLLEVSGQLPKTNLLSYTAEMTLY